MRAVAGALVLLAACGSAPTTEVAAVEKVKARRVLEEAHTFHDETQKAIDEAAAAVREAERVIAAEQAKLAREKAAAAAAARAARSATSVRPRPSEAVSGGSVWDSLARCESGGNWSINTGNGYYGGLQMNMDFWRSYGRGVAPRPDLASREQQIAAAERARDGGRGYHPWPHCARKLGLI